MRKTNSRPQASLENLAATSALALMLSGTAEAVPINLSQATCAIEDSITVRLEGVAARGSYYWAELAWDKYTNKFILEYGEMPVPDGYVRIEPGTFMMGSPSDEPWRDDDETQHEVTLTRGFYMKATEVTQAEWVEVMGSNPSFFGGCDMCPVEQVSWVDATEYCNALSMQKGKEPVYEINGSNVNWQPNKNGYRLPTEAEWEYACRAGTTTPIYIGDLTEPGCEPDSLLDQIAWYCANVEFGTNWVGQKLPNAWGLYDMIGNVEEWCWDWYGEYPAGPVTDPTGPESGTTRVERGGSWDTNGKSCRSANRDWNLPGEMRATGGFRPVVPVF